MTKDHFSLQNSTQSEVEKQNSSDFDQPKETI